MSKKIIDELITKYSGKIYAADDEFGDTRFNLRTVKGIAKAAGISSEYVRRGSSGEFIGDTLGILDPYYGYNSKDPEKNKVEIEGILNLCVAVKKRIGI